MRKCSSYVHKNSESVWIIQKALFTRIEQKRLSVVDKNWHMKRQKNNNEKKQQVESGHRHKAFWKQSEDLGYLRKKTFLAKGFKWQIIDLIESAGGYSHVSAALSFPGLDAVRLHIRKWHLACEGSVLHGCTYSFPN